MGATCGKQEEERPRVVETPLELHKKDMVKVKEGNVREFYKIRDELSSEKFSTLFKCQNIATKKRYLAKFFSISEIDEEGLQAFLKEAELLREADHPNIVKVVDIFKDPLNAIIIIEHCKGGELLERVRREEDLTEAQIATYIKEITSAVAYLHSKGIVHRDIRPESFAFLDNEKNSSLKLVDFGNCKHFEKNMAILERVGTPYYMAPEVIFKNYNEKCDTWSIGVILYMLLSGTLPFPGNSEEEIIQNVMTTELTFEGKRWKKVSAEAKDLISHLLIKSVPERLTASEILRHQFIKNCDQGTAKDQEVLTSALRNLSKFESESKLQRATLAFIVSQVMSSDELGGLKETFRLIDKDGDGMLSREEIKEAMETHTGFNEHNIDALISKVDLDNNGQVNYSEFLAATINWENEMSRERLEQAFRAFDADHSGKISVDELQAAFGGSHHSKQVFNDMVKEADTDRDGEIDLEEFCAYMNQIKTKSKELRAGNKKNRYSNFY